MDSFVLGKQIRHSKLGVVGVVTDEVILVKHIGNLLVRQVRVQVGEDKLEWLVENCAPFFAEQPALPNIMVVA